MTHNKKLKIIDGLIFGFILCATLMLFWNEDVGAKLDKCFLPEERNRGYYEILNKVNKYYISEEMMEKGTENLLANYMKSGDRKEGYSINVNSDGSFSISGSYNGDKNKYESLLPIGVGFDLETGDYILSDGGASTSDGISLKLTGAKRMIGGETSWVTLAELPGNGTFHWDRDPNIELYAEIVIRPGASVKELKFNPMLMKVKDIDDHIETYDIDPAEIEYKPCLTPNYDWESEEYIENTVTNKINVFKGSLDGELVTKDDWGIFTKSIKYQMQADRVVIDFQDGTGIEVNKKEFPLATYGKINASKTIIDGHEIKLTDYQVVMDSIKPDASDISSPELKNIRDFYTYLKTLDHENYIVFISVKDDGISALNNGIFSLLQKIGVNSGLMDSEKDSIKKKKNYQNSFLCILRHRNAEVEQLDEQKLMSEGELSDGTSYRIESCGKKTDEPKASIQINGTEYSMNMRGMNIVVYDEEKHEVVDSVCFDTCSGLWCHRQPGTN